MERMRRREFVLGVVARASLVVPPAVALAFVGYQVEGGVATNFAGAGFGAAFGAAGGALESIGDSSSQPSTRNHFLNSSIGALVGAMGGCASINFTRINRFRLG